jgi:tripartite-type tricarboxylate transporter receptor subunit TctC
VRGNRVRGLAVTSAQRMASAADIPTIAESGLPGYDMATWFGLLAPAATPREIITRLQSEAARTLNAPEVKERMLAQGLSVVADTPDAFAALVQQEIPRWKKVVEAAGLKPE